MKNIYDQIKEFNDFYQNFNFKPNLGWSKLLNRVKPDNEIIENFHESRCILERIVEGDSTLRNKFNAELEKLREEQAVALRANNLKNDLLSFCYWTTPCDIIKIFNKVNRPCDP